MSIRKLDGLYISKLFLCVFTFKEIIIEYTFLSYIIIIKSHNHDFIITYLCTVFIFFRMMTNAQYHEEELSKRKEKLAMSDNNALKGQKLITLSSKIADHDLLTYVKKVAKLLEKNHEVRVVISGEEKEQTKLVCLFNI